MREKDAKSFQVLPVEIVFTCLCFLRPTDILAAEEVCKWMQNFTKIHKLWKVIFTRNCLGNAWRLPGEGKEPDSWKKYYYLYKSQRGLKINEKMQNISAAVRWRVPIPKHFKSRKIRSREFKFSKDALGEAITWQIEVECLLGVPVYPEIPGAVLPHAPPYCTSASIEAKKKGKYCNYNHSHQMAKVRIWTTNTWTPEMTDHYYGSYCTIVVRDIFDEIDIIPEAVLDIDSGNNLMIDTCNLSGDREIVLRIDLTLALMISAPLAPLYTLLSSKDESCCIKIGYCRAIFEIARCKRKYGSTFSHLNNRSISSLVALAAEPRSSQKLRSELFQALLNLLSPAAVFIPDDLAGELLRTCINVLRDTPVPHYNCFGMRQTDVSLAQNVSGSLFNLLVHPVARELIDEAAQLTAVGLLEHPAYRLCTFSILAVLLTSLNWGTLCSSLEDKLSTITSYYMKSNNPLDTDCTGVAWDETDIAAYFLPLLCSSNITCVTFSSWCLNAYYFHTAVNI